MRPPEPRGLGLVCCALAAGVLLTSSPALAAEGPPALKELMPRGMLIGVALSQRQSDGEDAMADGIVSRQFDSATPENVLKWEKVHPEPGRYDFAPADRYVAFAEKRGMTVIGHVLVWHSQTPAWVFAGKDGAPLDRETALARMGEHIRTVVGRYKGRIKGWDVVNEAVDDGPEGKLRSSKWREAIGDDYIAKAFEFAHEADPAAELYYNDYNLTVAPKRATALRIVKELKQRGIRVDGVGEQGHWLLGGPPLADIEATINDIAAAGLKVLITELDVDVLPRDPAMYGADLQKKASFRAETNLYPDALPKEKQEELARRYASVFALFLKHRESIARVTFWGVTDAQSWLNGFPIPGRVNHPLLFDRQGQPKPAFEAVVETLKRNR
jgi:endo-1,4-beta-xylanase